MDLSCLHTRAQWISNLNALKNPTTFFILVYNLQAREDISNNLDDLLGPFKTGSITLCVRSQLMIKQLPLHVRPILRLRKDFHYFHCCILKRRLFIRIRNNSCVEI